MKNTVASRLLSEVKEFLITTYAISVRLIKEDVVLSRQVAEWKNHCLVIDVRNRGIQGSLCILCHVFGHLMQFSTMKDRYADLWSVVGGKQPPLVLDDEFKSRYFLYEKEAYEIGKALLERVTVVGADIEGMYQAFMFTDFEHYWAYLVTGKESSRWAFNRRFRQLQQEFQKLAPEPLVSMDLPDVLGDLSGTEILVV